MEHRSLLGRTVGVANVAVGALLLTRPAGTVAPVADSRHVPTAVARVLGGRHVVQGAVQLGWPVSGVLTASIVVDALHATSMVGLAALRPGYRRPAALSAAVASGSGALSALARQRARRR